MTNNENITLLILTHKEKLIEITDHKNIIL